MVDRPLLKLPNPSPGQPRRGRGFPSESVKPSTPSLQGERLGPKFERLSQVLPNPENLATLRGDPASIAPERALVFELASGFVDFQRAIRGVPGLEFLGEDHDEVPPDENFSISEKPEKKIPRRIYFTMPDARALREIVSLWNRYLAGKDLERGKGEWKKVFNHLADIRPWGPKDRITEDAKDDWLRSLSDTPDEAIRFEVEFWFRTNDQSREQSHKRLSQMIHDAGGKILNKTTITEIRYDAALLEVRPQFIKDILDNPDLGLAAFDEVMVLRPQSLVKSSYEVDFDDLDEIKEADQQSPRESPRAALLDGLPMAQHTQLANRLSIDDPDDYGLKYGEANEQIHGTNMASLIIHGDLNKQPANHPIHSELYVRPVMYPQKSGFGDERSEMMPPNQLPIDLLWRSFIRMFEGEGGDEATAPEVKIVNISLGDSNRRFAGVLSPWARLIDYVSWKYKVLILVSAGNNSDQIPLDQIKTWQDFENLHMHDRENVLLKAILEQRASRQILTPSEGMNVLTVGACHTDAVVPNGSAPMAVDPCGNPGLPNPSSALGLGYLRSVKPEIFLPGGREHVQTRTSHAPILVSPVGRPARYFGIGAAAPGLPGQLDRKINTSGTSTATALATHSALKILEQLDEIPSEPGYPSVDSNFHAVLLKSLLVHAAKWDSNLVAKISALSKEMGNTYWEHQREDVSRFLGFGVVDINRVLECTERRATLIGWNSIRVGTIDEFRIPLPPQLKNMGGFRAVTATVGWLTPLNIGHRMYRMAKFDIEPGSDNNLSLDVNNSKEQPSHNAFGKGTVYHRRWEGHKAADFVDDGHLVLHVTCKPASGPLDGKIPYGLAVTLEVGDDVAVPVYDEIRMRLRQAIAQNVRP